MRRSCEQLSLKAAKAAYLGAAIGKDFPEGRFSGTVAKVEGNVRDGAGELWDMLFLIKYKDGDKEHLTLDELRQHLVDSEGCQRRLEAAVAAEAGAGPHHGENENDENEQAAGGGQATKRQRTTGVLRDATDRSRNAVPAPGEERRSRREVKRRHDEEFEYEETRTAKRGAAAGAAGARSRFGIRPPAAAAALAAACPVSESEEPVPTGEDGMRLVGLPGHLKTIEVTNFMCHEHFTMEYGQHVTFVSGTNGSGKSAALQALQCCLGVKASDTGRANTFKKLIRTGADEAIIRITLWNKPYKNYDAYRHNVFGDTITVERKISANGTSGYALKDAAGRVHGRKRDELDMMLQTLGINAANPVCVMTQDTARNFLAGSSTKADQEKYQLYMEATQLDQISYNLQQSKQQIRQMDESVQQIREEYEGMKAQQEELRKAIEALRGIEGWRQEVQERDKVLTWAVVEEHTAAAGRLAEALAPGGEATTSMQQAQQELEELEREHDAMKQAVEGKAAFLASFQERAEALRAEAEAQKTAHKEAHKAVRLADSKIRQLREALVEESARKETMEQAAREVAHDTVAATQAVMAQYQAELDAARDEDEQVNQQVGALEAAFREAADAARAAHERAQGISAGLDALQAQQTRLQHQIADIKAAGRSKLAAFGGRAVVELMQAIKQAGARFSRPPIGPLGQYLHLEDSRWAMAVEAALGFKLNAFIVHSMADSQLLRQLIGRCFQGMRFSPEVYVCNFDLPQHSIPGGAQPPPAMPTLYRLLSVSEARLAAPIMNMLVDTAHIEQVALGSSHNDCKQAAYRTPNVKECYGADGSKYYKRGSTQTFTPKPNWVQVARLGHSAAQQTSELEAEIARLQGEAAQLQQQHGAAQHEVAAANQAEREARRALGKAKSKQWQTNTALTQLTQAPPPELAAATQAEDGDEALQADIVQATQVCIDLEQQLRGRQGALEEAQAAERQAHAAWEEKKAAVQRLHEENEQFLGSYREESQRLAEVDASVAEQRQKLEDAKAWQAQVQARLEETQAELATLEEAAVQACSREEGAAAKHALLERLRAKGNLSEEELSLMLTPEILAKKIGQLEKKIAEHERAAGGSLPELQAQYEASRARMAKDGRRFRDAIKLYEAEEYALKLRIKKLKELDHNLEQVVNTKFRYYMWKKGHTGTIKLDRKARTLQLKVAVNAKGAGGGAQGGEGGAREVAAVKDLKQLSGGERSYTTVAFTLALGGQTDMPFRAMDEFDVFMDAINRRVAMQNLFSFAKDNPELQFIFLTPQDISAVEDARQACQAAGQLIPEGFVRVVQMRPARTNATHA
ncbi:structural maintenance of chromosomes 6B isoform A [Chlorella sorokiniana]|uniref:Structural maintenance of chromosomes 6B isoform A n=1 Tax=Chlorella sorokiniana TaxID=3076 RepID=A0A2P6TCZ3_CHLSO|nr:structural maintenance of chromosomes 6B isoform A [Chlorella sorokiniana]|eukprot:PRW20506.1 structural maintenance of chromosomes 6B isoform A [Chlorella sorokiniana]